MPTLLLAILLTAAAPEIEVQTLDGKTLSGRLTALDAQQATFETSEGRVSLELDKLLGISCKRKPAARDSSPGISIELVDGSAVVARDYAVSKGQARITLGGGEVIETSTANIASVRFQAASDAVEAEWARIVGMKLAGDVVVVRAADHVDYHQGALKDVSNKAVDFQLEGEVIPVKRAKLFGLIYYHAADRPLAAPLGFLSDTAGSRWALQSLEISDELQWTTPSGVRVRRPWDALAQIDLSGGKIVYLSDLKAEAVRWTPFLGMATPHRAIDDFFAPRMDKNLAAQPLELDGKQYRKGVALHSRTELEYRLPGRFSRLKALAGIDDGVRPQGNVRLVIRGDDRVLLETAIRGSDPPQPLDLDLSGVRRLTILADFGDATDAADHLDLCDARIVK